MKAIPLFIMLSIFKMGAQSFPNGLFIDVDDTCNTLFLDKQKVVHRFMCYPENFKVDFYDKNDPESKMGNCGDTLTYDLTKRGKQNNFTEYFFDFRTIQGKECERNSLMWQDSFIIMTDLKTLPGIRDHYRVPKLMIKKEFYKTFSRTPFSKQKIIIDSIDRFHKYNYIAFAQPKPDSNNIQLIDSQTVIIGRGGIAKTALTEDLLAFAFKNIEGFIKIGSKIEKIPVLFETSYNKGTLHLPLEKRENYIKTNEKVFFHPNYFLVIARFNPSRDGVNEAFGEKIEGQVLCVDLIKINDFIKGI